MTRLPLSFALALTALVLPLSGCHVETHKNGNGNDNVDIGTPFGSMHVKTDDKATGADTGLTPYPGSTLLKKDKNDNGAADISMNFGDFKLGVHAVDLTTPDPQDKVVAFYKNDMTRYGTVLTCRGQNPVGTPVRTEQGLTCGSAKNEINVSDADQLELRAGSERHQHIVGVRPENGSTRIDLVALDLPGSSSHHDSSERE